MIAISGGRYDYLCYKRDLDDLVNREHTLREMADRLAALGYAEDAAKETEELLVLIRQWKVRTEVRAKRLADVWKAVEWWDSCDWSEDQVREALAKYRDEGVDDGPRPVPVGMADQAQASPRE